jgi:hypothetical protein
MVTLFGDRSPHVSERPPPLLEEQLMAIVNHLAHPVFEEGWSLALAEPVEDPL